MSSNHYLQRLYGPWAIVTGASSGIGDQFARQLAAAGLNLILVARREARLTALKSELESQHSVTVELQVLDLGVVDAIDQLLAALAGRDIGLVVSNAGFGLKGPFNNGSRAELDAMLNVNVRAPLLLLHSLLPQLRARQRAGIIVTGSIEGETAFPWSSAYAGTKAFVNNFGLSLFGELKKSNVDLLVLEPGSTDTEAAGLQGITRENLVGLMSAAQVAGQALRALGQQPLLITGWHNRAFIKFLRFLPQRMAIALAGKGMATALARSGKPIKV